MSKKNQAPSTPESRAEKLANKQMLRKVFSKTFYKAFVICLSVLLIYSVCYIAFINPSNVGAVVTDPLENAANGAVVPNAGGSDAGGSADVPAPTVTEITTDSSQADIVAYFNGVMNNVKPNAKTVTVVKETNSQAGSIEGTIPGSLVSVANSLIEKNMGDKKDLPAPATTAADKNKVFPVENETWSSKLTAEDVDKATVTEADGVYTITLNVKADPLSTETAHGKGHNGKVFSIITPQVTLDNAGGAAKMLKNVQTGHKDGKIVVTVDKATGHVLTANYYFVWTLSLEALGVKISIPFGLEKQIKVDW